MLMPNRKSTIVDACRSVPKTLSSVSSGGHGSTW